MMDAIKGFFRDHHAVPANDAGPQWDKASNESLRGWAAGRGPFAEAARTEFRKRGVDATAGEPFDPVPAWMATYSTEAVRAWTQAAGAEDICSFGMSWVKRFLAAHVAGATDRDAERFRAGCIMRAMREHCERGGPVVMHADKR
jgi:hypothetical protein